MITRHTAQAESSTSIYLGDQNTLPDSIQWMPPGKHSIVPYVNGKPQRISFTVTAKLAENYNQQLQQMRAEAKEGQGDEPYIDFNHKDEERAGEVLEFYWGGDDPKTGGIRARISWSAAGREAILGRNWRRFSPQWDFDPQTHEPLYISTNLGGLVNRAAFKTIAPVVAKDGSAATHNQNEKNMDIKDIEAALDKRFQPLEQRLIALEKPATTAAAKSGTENADLATTVATAVATGLKPVIDRMDKVEKESVKAQARAAIQPHITRGAIGPQDADAIALWENAWTANAKSAEAQMAKLPGTRAGRLTNPTRTEDNPSSPAEPVEQFMEDAAKTRKASGKGTLADALIAQARSAEGQEQYKTFRSTWASRN